MQESSKLETGQSRQAWLRALQAVQGIAARPRTLLARLAERAETDGEAPALLHEAGQLSYRQLVARARQYSHWAIRRGFPPGHVVGLLMPNCPEYAAIWLGLTEIGCVVALLNTSLVGEALLHSITAAGAADVIVAAALEAPLAEAAARLPALSCHRHGAGSHDSAGIEQELLDLADMPDIALPAPPGMTDTALLIYTSGTTGWPKAAKVSHGRIVEWSLWFAGLTDAGAGDRLYNCLPMYHSIGGVVAIGSMLVGGGSVLIRERFSASRFWHDVVEGDCTIFQYIGELCRYLVQMPAHPLERRHRLRLCCGNGLSREVWEAFAGRFAVPRILEFYAATEGNISLYNCEGKPGAIGRVPPFLTHRFPVALVRPDPATGEPLRDAAGFCTPCAPDEAGEAIGNVLEAPAMPAREFQGYTDQAATAAKLLRDVFTEGDRWFRSGDLMRKDSAGFFYFIDRLGDTFRWKGENVSTAELAAAIAACPGVVDAVAFGVAVPGHEGRAGMAAVVGDGAFELAALCQTLAAKLPPYARPLFIRLCRSIEVTGTFKLKKSLLAQEGYAAPSNDDPIWFVDWRTGLATACDAAFRQRIAMGTLNRL